MATDSLTDRDVKNRLAGMFIGWNAEFKDIPAMSGVAHLKDSLPRKQKAAPVVRPPTPDSEDDSPATPQRSQGHSRNASASTPKQPARKSSMPPTTNETSSSTSRYTYVEPTTPPKEKSSSSFFGGGSGSSSNKTKVPKESRPLKVSLEKEKPRILQTIAAANQASTNLQNALKHVNKEDASFLRDPQILKSHKDCRELRKNVLHYIAGIESEEWVGTLLQTNDGLVNALQLHEQYRLIATAPDSDEEEQRELQRRHVTDVYGVDDADLPPRQPPRPNRPVSTGPAISRGNKPGKLAMPAPPLEESESEEEEESEADEESILSEGDEDDPFANRNEDLALKTPAIEKAQPKW